MENDFVIEIRKLRRENKAQRADLLISITRLDAMTTDRDNWKQRCIDLQRRFSEFKQSAGIFSEMFGGKKN